MSKEYVIGLLLMVGVVASVSARDPAPQPEPPDRALGYPSREPDLDVLPGFRNPPPGYGEVPFWWWSGEDLDVDRMIAQVRDLHGKGISGVQVNYSHYDTPGWMTDVKQPPIFSKTWWDVYGRVSQVCGELDMGIGLSTYTIDWPRGAPNLFHHLFYSKPELNAIELVVDPRQRVRGGEAETLLCPSDFVAAHAYPVVEGELQRGGVDLAAFIREGRLTWTAPAGEWELWIFRAVRKGGSLNPLMAGSGDTVISGFFQPFQDHNPGKSSKGLNYFFNDELHIGVDKFAWNPDFAQEFHRRKGYDLFEVLPALWQDLGPMTPKVRMDYADVRMSLLEERYFQPIYEWHASRGMIFGCDSGGRGRRPNEFGDYFRATRWYTAPGHDTPGGRADLVKGKVSSSVANLYQRPRVWLEGYHSLGWGATPEQLMFATRENYLYGCTLLNLHGLYYSTYGSHWEWAPPCYHFRMPYWEHMDVFLKYFERLSYLLSQGHLVADVAVVYPVAPYEAEMNGDKSKETAFTLAGRLMSAGINFEFIDNDSLARAVVQNGRLMVKDAGASYQALILPDMDAVRWPTIEKAAAFAEAGGKVYAVGALPSASDRAGRDDPQLEAMNERAFKPECRFTEPAAAIEAVCGAFVQDVFGMGRPVRALHRKAGPRDVYFVMDAAPGTVVEFRAKGAVELWDAWTGESRPLRVVEETATGTRVELPLEAYEAQVVVFTPGRQHVNPPDADERVERQKTLSGEWTAAFVPTMDNTYGDFRLPVTADNKRIGVEARRFAWARETKNIAQTAMLPDTDDRSWETKLHGYGTRFYVLGPVPDDAGTEQLEAALARLATVDPAVPVKVGGRELSWKPYDFSWRYGKEGDPGHQGYHGLKGTITDDFLCLGKPVGGLNETRYVDEAGGGRYYLWTVATVSEPVSADVLFSREAPADKSHTSPVLTPSAVYVNGKRIVDLGQPVHLNAGANATLIRYEHAGRGHFVLRRASSQAPPRAKLAMRWYGDPAVIPLDVSPGDPAAEWFRFLSAPGTTAIRVHALGKVQAWIDGKPMTDVGDGRFVAAAPSPRAAVVALRIVPQIGSTGGAAIPEPVVVETDGNGSIPLGDWSQLGILNNYSGGVRYRTSFTLTADEAKADVTLDLGRVIATAEVHLNGRKVGVRVAPPWHFDVTELLKPGDNRLEVLVYSTLANHYQTIPSRYRGSPKAGLFGPVRLLSRDWDGGESAISSGLKRMKPLTRISSTALLLASAFRQGVADKPTVEMQETLPALKDAVAPRTVDEMWAGFDPRAEPLEVELLKEWEEEGVVLRVLRYRVGIFKGKKAMMAAVYGYPKGGEKLPGLVQIHGGGQYADHKACLANGKRGYATVSIAWAGRISAPDYRVTPHEVKLFWDGKDADPRYRLTTDWGAVDGYHAPGRNPGNVFPSAKAADWTLDDVESPRNSGWFLCALAARRALTFLEEQPEVDPDRLGVYGHSMGGKLTVMTAVDPRVKAAAPSCGGVSDRDNDSLIYRTTLGDDVSLKKISCPIVFLSPANDFHGRIGDLPKAIAEIGTEQWRVTCSPHHNHQDTPPYEVATMLWMDQHLKRAFSFPQTPEARLSLKTDDAVPSFSVRPDRSKPIGSVDVFYTQHGKSDEGPRDRENTMRRFWRHSAAREDGGIWSAKLPLSNLDTPLWVYANVTYPLDEPVSGAGYYYGTYTAHSFNVSSLLQVATPQELVSAGVRASREPSRLIESFEGDWEKEWFTYRPDEWARSTHKLGDEAYAAPEGATLAVDVLALQTNTLVILVDDYAAEVQLSGGDSWQTAVLEPQDFRDASGDPLESWKNIKRLKLTPTEHLKPKSGTEGNRRQVGRHWRGAEPQFRNLRWQVRGRESRNADG